MKFLVAPGTSSEEAYALAVQNGCNGYYLSVPPVWQDQSVAEGWTYPCIVTMNDEGLVANWAPA